MASIVVPKPAKSPKTSEVIQYADIIDYLMSTYNGAI